MASTVTAMPARMSDEEWRTRCDLAACYRLVDMFGWSDLINTRITARVPGRHDHFLINAYGLLFEEVTASSLVKIDAEGNKVEGLMMCESKMVTKGGGDVDIGCGNSFGGTGEDDEGVDSGVEQVNNVIDGFQYTETQIGTANDFKSWIKEYMNAVVLKLREKGKPKEEIQKFKATASDVAKFFLKNFSDVQFYLGPSFNSESMVFSIYPEGAVTPNFYYIMGGFAAEKF